MATAPFIDGVLIHREIFNPPVSDWMVGTKSELRFHCHRYSIPSTALKPRAYSQPIPFFEQLLGISISILYMHMPTRIEKSRDLQVDLDAPYFFQYWIAKPLLRATHTVVFRSDRKPLHPGQVEVLCRFCAGGFVTGEIAYFWSLAYTRDLTYANKNWRERAQSMKTVWKDNCTVDTFHAYFHVYRYYRLMEGDERWREVKPIYDV